MDVLSESLHRAVAAPPPSRIDVDALIAREGRRRRLLIGGSAVSTAGGVAVVLMAQILYAGGPSPGGAATSLGPCVAPTPSVTRPPNDPSPPPRDEYPAEKIHSGPSPNPVMEPANPEPVDAAKRRLSGAFAAAVRAAMPGVPFTDGSDPSCSLPQVITFDPAFPYESSVTITDAKGRGDIVVHLYRASTVHPDCGRCAWHEDLPGGGLAWGESDTPWRVDVWRPDGTGNMIFAVDHRGDPARAAPPATRAQMIAIGTYPALSIDP